MEYLVLNKETVFILSLMLVIGGFYSLFKTLSLYLHQFKLGFGPEDMYLFSQAYKAFEYYRMVSIIMCFTGFWVFGLILVNFQNISVCIIFTKVELLI